MRQIQYKINTGFAGADHEDTIEVEDNTTDEETNKMIWDIASELIHFDWKEIKAK